MDEKMSTQVLIYKQINQVDGLQVLWDVAACLTIFLTVMAEETTDCSNQEQVTVIIHGIMQNLEVHENFWACTKLVQFML